MNYPETVSGATQLLVRDNSQIAAIIGAGAQGETQLEAVCCVRDITKAYVLDLNSERAESFAAMMTTRLGVEVLTAPSVESLKEADIICTSTSSSTPSIQ